MRAFLLGWVLLYILLFAVLFLSGCATITNNVPEDVAVPAAYTADAINWIHFLVR